jgi:hypothetical protein
MRVLEYSDLDLTRVRPQYEKVKAQLERGDLRSADLKKLAGADLYRARLDHSSRLLVKLMRHRGERVALALEVVENHAYDRARFLRGAAVDEDKIAGEDPAAVALESLPELPYVNPSSPRFHLLDKVISFDEAQEAVYRVPPPLILIGSAGSGKTALALEKLKLATGDVLYVTRSPYLVRHARNLYFTDGYAAEHQNADFLSLREVMETIQVPEGREVGYADFRAWSARHRQAARGLGDAHTLFEEFRGVLTGAGAGAPWLSREDYLALGVRRSIFPPEERVQVYDLFEKYLAWLREASLYDGNVAAHALLARASRRYDFVAVDEVQDLTRVELTLVLSGLRQAGRFVLCGDSNQIVHPNLFSWANVKSLFFEQAELAPRREMFVLRANYRNAVEVTEAANRLLKVKLARFGSIDRESHYLVEALPGNGGQASLLPDKEAAVRELDAKTHRSARLAVIVLREADKAEAARRFRTPLLFSVQEAKGLEYESVVLYNLVASARGEYAHIAAGVSPADLEADLAYARAADKRDKSIETHKFFVNALYVAMTRAVRRLFLVEKDPAHPLLHLMGLAEERAGLDLPGQVSTTEEWQQEARRLELQGKQEQAEAIRRGVLHLQPPPWQVFDAEHFCSVAGKALDPACVSSKLRRQVLEYAAVYREYDVLERLVELGFAAPAGLRGQGEAVARRHLQGFEGRASKDALRLVDQYGVDYRSPFNFTPLMLAGLAGNVDLARALVDRGADPELVDNAGRTALHLALGRARADAAYAVSVLPALWSLLAPASISLEVEGRLLKVDAHLIEYVLFQLMYALQRDHLCTPTSWERLGMRAGHLLEAAARLPAAVLRPDRRRREYLSGVLSRNEDGRDYPYNRRLFLRLAYGRYVLNPRLLLRRGEAFVPLYDAMGLRRMAALGLPRYAEAVQWIDEALLARERGRPGPAPSPRQSSLWPEPEQGH